MILIAHGVFLIHALLIFLKIWQKSIPFSFSFTNSSLQFAVFVFKRSQAFCIMFHIYDIQSNLFLLLIWTSQWQNQTFRLRDWNWTCNLHHYSKRADIKVWKCFNNAVIFFCLSLYLHCHTHATTISSSLNPLSCGKSDRLLSILIRNRKAISHKCFWIKTHFINIFWRKRVPGK